MNISEIIDNERFLHLNRNKDGFYSIRLKNLDGTVAHMTDKDLERLLLAFHQLIQLECKAGGLSDD